MRWPALRGSGVRAVLVGAAVIGIAVAHGSADGLDTAVSNATLVRLGERLFFDRNLSADSTISCATCHQPDHAFTDVRPIAEGIAASRGTRNTPSLIGVGDRANLTWDGRETRLEAQVLRPFVHTREHGLRDSAALLAKLGADHTYHGDFAAAFGDAKIDIERIGAALASYLRTLAGGESAYDRFVGGDTAALSESAQRGYQLFRGPAGCADCHRADGARSTFTDESFHRVGIGLPAIASRLSELTQRVAALPATDPDARVLDEPELAALGRFLVTRDPHDIGAYRTPSLRNVAVTGPYMHDGSVTTLRDAVDLEVYYQIQGRGHPLAVNVDDRTDLVEFLKALTDARYVRP
jgi:cytochrome c peroxidase